MKLHRCLLPLLFPLLSIGAIPIQDLIRESEFRTFRISPSGDYVSFIAKTKEDFRNIYVIDLTSGEAKLITGEKANVQSYFWANDTRILYSTDGDNRVFNGLYGVNADGSKMRALIEPVMQSLSSAFTGIQASGRLFSLYSEDPDEILVFDTSRHFRYPDIKRMNVYNGRMKTYYNNTQDFNGLVMDGEGVIRFGVTFDDEGRIEIFYRKDEDSEFNLLHSFDSNFVEYDIVDFADDNESVYVVTNHLKDKASLYRLKLDDMSYELLYEDPTYDLTGSFGGADLIFSNKSGRLLGLSYEGAKPITHWFHKQIGQLQKMVDDAFPETVNQLIDSDDDQSKFIIASFSARQPTIYRLLTINPLSVTELGKSKPWIDPNDLPECRPIEYKSRDGRTIHGYLFLPVGYKEGEKVPLLTLPHGGPWARDNWGFRSYLDTLQIFPATRGWAVMQVNFRGSTGYGKDHLVSSYKHPDKMNEDYIDGINWAIEEGIADPDHIAIMGASWGGYATMYGITKYPDLFKFGINIFGVVDLARQINWYRLRTKWAGRRDAGFESWAVRMGDPDDPEDKAILDAASPINFIDQIKADLLVYHGTQDVNVDIEQSRILRGKLNSEKIPYQWISKSDEHHSIRNFDNRLELYQEIEKLLNKHGK